MITSSETKIGQYNYSRLNSPQFIKVLHKLVVISQAPIWTLKLAKAMSGNQASCSMRFLRKQLCTIRQFVLNRMVHM